LGHGEQELLITRQTESGSLTVVVFIEGKKSTSFTVPFSPIIEIVWSIPPHAVPAILSAVIVNYAKRLEGTLSIILFACIAVTAVQTVKAELELNPAAIGTRESIIILSPTGFLTRLLIPSL
jgi:hypothetical protein